MGQLSAYVLGFLTGTRGFVPYDQSLPTVLLRGLAVMGSSNNVNRMEGHVSSIFQGRFRHFVGFFVYVFSQVRSLVVKGVRRRVEVGGVKGIGVTSSSGSVQVVLASGSYLRCDRDVI